MKIGVDYYPEHWERDLWKADADLMKKTGVQIVRLGEFAWSRFEPEENVFQFEWLDEVIELFAKRGIQVVLCTPTNCPPLWLYEKYPDAVQTGRDGQKIATGIRGHRCYNNPDFRRYAARIVEKMTERYADHPAVVAWQIDNELEANFCCCERCTEAFRTWLKEKYGTIDHMNRRYGNNVWSGGYSAWEQVKPPFGSYPYAWYNPSMMLDFCRYASDNMIEYVKWQADLIRKHCPEAKITTNTWFCENLPDFYKEFETLDFVSYDNYPVSRIPKNPEVCYSHAFHLDLMRGIKRENFWIMEQLSGGMGCWAPMTSMPEPGMIEGYTLQAMAHGADTVLHFRWRSAVSGAEMFWHGLLDHSNVPGRRFEEFAHLCKTVQTLVDIEDTRLYAPVAILNIPDNEWAFKIQPQTEGMYYLEQMKLFHDAFTGCGINVDIIGADAPLDEYRVVVAPQMYILNEQLVQRLYAFAEKGGTVILTNRSGVKDSFNKCIMEPLPTVYRGLAGAYALEYNPLGRETSSVRFADGTVCKVRQWCDILKPESAEVLASYDCDFYAGKAAITRNTYGTGSVYYVGTVGKKDLYRKLVRDILKNAQVPYVEGLPANVELTTRKGNGKLVQFVFNNTDQVQDFVLEGMPICMQPFEMKIRRM